MASNPIRYVNGSDQIGYIMLSSYLLPYLFIGFKVQMTGYGFIRGLHQAKIKIKNELIRIKTRETLLDK
jgi:hypothetical protein